MRANPTRMWERWRDAADAHQWSVVIGNVGTVITTTLESAARNTYDEYVTISMNGSGRAAHEEVTLLRDGDIISNHQPLPHSDDLDDDEIDEMVHEASDEIDNLWIKRRALRAAASLGDFPQHAWNNLAWEFTGNACKDSAFPLCDRCEGAGYVESPGGMWAIYERCYTDD